MKTKLKFKRKKNETKLKCEICVKAKKSIKYNTDLFFRNA